MAKRPTVTGHRGPVDSWNADVREALEDLRRVTASSPKLFPNGVTKVELALEVKAGATLRFLVEGPAGGSQIVVPLEFEFQPPPKSLRTAASPTEGGPANQKKLKSGTTLEGTAKLFEHACLGQPDTYLNSCAHYLSNAFIRAGFTELAQPHDCVSLGGRCGTPECKTGGKRIIRAKDLRCWFKTKDSQPVSRVEKNTGFYAVYQERQSDGQGHVVTLDSNAWLYYGTGWFEAGLPSPNDWKHEYYQWA